MVDEIYDRTYQSGRADLNAGIDRAVLRIGKALSETIGTSLKVLHRVEWSAPWAPKTKNTQCG